MKEIYIGAAYYPEVWSEDELQKDIERCKELGINTLRIGEFAWEKMEPQEGVYDLKWLREIVDELYKNGIYTLLCTPSATPPRWLLNKYEETRLVSAQRVRVEVSSRCHTCKTSPVMREKNRGVTLALAREFAGHKGVIGWQLDNEIFPYGDGCYCPLCKSAFREYLRHIYGAIDKLNDAWGMSRWSLSYSDFDEIQPPYPEEWRHPSLRTAWFDFQCAQIVSYLNEQAEILHEYSDAPVGTDMMSHNDLSYYKTLEKLDVAQYNHYDTAANLPRTAFAYDFLRTVKDKPFWVTETQVGWNGSEFAESGYRPVGNAYANTWLSIAHGAEMNLYWLFRTHPSGHELGHGALYTSAGRLNRVSEEVRRAAADIGKCREFLLGTKVKSRIAMHYSSTAMNNFAAAPIVEGFDYRKTLVDVHSAFAHYNVDVIDTQHSLENYDVLISPFTSTLDEYGFKERVLEWVAAGGKWIVGPMSDIMDARTRKYTHAPYSFLEEAAGVYTKYQKPISNDVFTAEWTDGKELKISTTYDAYEPLAGTESLAKYKGEFDGLSVVTRRRVGKGEIILLGSRIDNNALLKLVGVSPIAEASDNINLCERVGKETGIIAVECENTAGYAVLKGIFKEIISGRTVSGRVEIPPCGVAVFVKQ